MTSEALVKIAPRDVTAKAYHYGRLTPWILSFDKKMPKALASALSASINAIGLAQPVTVHALSPWLVLELTRG